MLIEAMQVARPSNRILAEASAYCIRELLFSLLTAMKKSPCVLYISAYYTSDFTVYGSQKNKHSSAFFILQHGAFST